MTKTLLSLALICCTYFIYSQSDKRLKGIEKELNSILETSKAAGFAIAIVEKDKVVYAKGFGYRDFENKVPADANTLFAIGSSTKAFTSSVLGILREDDKIDFNDSPRDYVPGLKFSNDELNNNVIIKDLMRHTSGLPRHDGAWYFFPSHNKDSLVMRMKYQEPFTGVRQQWYYNNFGFLLQGVIAEKLTDSTWEQLIEQKFFKPLGMVNSRTAIKGMKESSNAAIGYNLDNDRNISKMEYYDIAGMSPAGSINSSVNDMTKWLITWINNGKYQKKQVIPESYIKEAMSSQAVVAAGLPNKELPNVQFANYGYGWFLHSYKGHYMVEHGGNIDGFSANVAFFPTDSLGVVVLANQNGSAIPRLARNIATDRMLKLDKTDWAGDYKEDLEEALAKTEEAKDKTEQSNVKNTRPSHIKMDYTGNYENKGYGQFDIIMERDSLFVYLNGKRNYLHHYHYDTFELISVVEGKVDTSAIGQSLKVNFTTNFAGDIDYLLTEIEPTTDPIRFKRTPNSIDVDEETLKSYVGFYDLMGTEIKTYIKDEKVLYVFVPGQPEYELVPVDKHLFNFKVLEGYKVEFTEVDGEITELKFIQPNGTFAAQRRKE